MRVIGSSHVDPYSALAGAAASVAASLVLASPSSAVVDGRDAAPGAYPAVAEITFGSSFLCTGTLIAPNYVLTAGHCGSVTGAAVATPAGWPAPLIDVRIGSNQSGQGEKVPVSRVIVEPDYLATSGHDITLLDLRQLGDDLLGSSNRLVERVEDLGNSPLFWKRW